MNNKKTKIITTGKDLRKPGDENADVDPNERQLIDEAFDPVSSEDEPIDRLALDDTDEDGSPLDEKNQADDLFGEDLDSELPEEEMEENDDVPDEEEDERESRDLNRR